jgi:hypothetical protein
MKKLYMISSLLLFGISVQAQQFWSEDFGTIGCNRGQSASAYTSANGAWTITATGSNGNVANDWFVSSASAGTGAGNCASSCVTAATENPTLHVSNISIVIPMFMTINSDTGASYFSGGLSSFGYVATTSRRAESPVINCTGRSNIAVSFVYLENGDAANDDASLVYSADGGTTWITIDPLAKTNTCTGEGQWTNMTVVLPASADNNPSVKIGFAWVNNDDGQGSDPSFSVDDITLSEGSTGVGSSTHTPVDLFSNEPGKIAIRNNGNACSVMSVTDLPGQQVQFSVSDNQILLEEAVTGIYLVTMQVNGVRVTRKVMVN